MRVALTLVLEVVFAGLTFGLRSRIQSRRTGSTGLVLPRRGAPPVERLGAGLIVSAILLLVASSGRLALLPKVWALGAFVAVVAGFELQVRFVEEAYLRRVHGDTYACYAARAGRFVAGIGAGAAG